MLEKTLESLLDCREIQQIHPKGNQFWIFIGKTDAEAKAPILWPPDMKNWLIGKDPDAGKDWRQEEKGMTEDEMVGWPCSPRDSQESSPTSQFKSINFLILWFSLNENFSTDFRLSLVYASCPTVGTHGLQYVRLLCPSLSPRVCSNSCHQVSDAIQPSCPLPSPSPPAFNLSQHQGLF